MKINVKHDNEERKAYITPVGGLKTVNRDMSYALNKPGTKTWEKDLAGHRKDRKMEHLNKRGVKKSVASKM